MPGSPATPAATATRASRRSSPQARDAADTTSYQAALSEIQQIVTRDDPAAIYLAQPQWLTVLRRDVGGFVPDLVVGEIVDFYALYREPATP